MFFFVCQQFDPRNCTNQSQINTYIRFHFQSQEEMFIEIEEFSSRQDF